MAWIRRRKGDRGRGRERGKERSSIKLTPRKIIEECEEEFITGMN